MPLPDYIVIRPDIGMDPAEMPPGLDGRWFERGDVPVRPDAGPVEPGAGKAVATPSGQLEVREDGAVAEVWLVSWWGTSA